MFKTSKGFSKVFKLMTVYMVMTLCAFFGYIVLFGNVTVPFTLPTEDSNASSDTYFSSMVSNLMEVESLDTDLSLSVVSNDMNLKVTGNVKFDLNSKSFDANMNLVQDTDTLSLRVVIPSQDKTEDMTVMSEGIEKNAYIIVNDVSYKINLAQEIDMSLIMSMFASDVNTDEILNAIYRYTGVDFSEIDLNQLMDKLEILEEEVEGGYRFIVTLGSLRATVLADSQFNIKSVKLREIEVGGYKINLNLGNVVMNNQTSDIQYEETGEEISLDGLTKVFNVTQELLNKDYISANVLTTVDNKNYSFDLAIDKSTEDVKVQISTLIDNERLTVKYVDKTIYFEFANLKFKFKDADVWYNRLDKIILAITGKDISSYLQTLVEELLAKVESALEEVSVPSVPLASLNLNSILPNYSFSLDGKDYLCWDNGLEISFADVDGVLSEVEFKCEDVFGNATFSSEPVEITIDGEFYDWTELLPITDFVDTALLTQRVEGQINTIFGETTFAFDVVVDFKDSLLIELSTKVFGEKISILYSDSTKLTYICVGEIVISATMSELQDVLSNILPENSNVLEIDGLLQSILDFCNIVEISQTEDAVLLVEYLENFGKIDINETSITGEVVYNEACITFELNAVEGNSVEIPTSANNFAKIVNLLNIYKQNFIEFAFDINYNSLQLQGLAKIKNFHNGLGGLVAEISIENICGQNAYIRIENGEIYFAYLNMKLKFALEADKTQEITNVIAEEVSNTTGVEINFGIFQELIDIVTNYTLADYLNLIRIDVDGDWSISITQSQGYITKELTAGLIFEEDTLSQLTFNILGVITGEVTLSDVQESTIGEFTDKDGFTTDFVAGIFDSAEVETNVYAISSDIAIRYSKTSFYGQMTAMLKQETEENEFGILETKFVPYVGIYTTSLNLSTYIYLIDSTVYIDLNGLQIYFNLNQNTIEEILAFVENELGIAMTENNQASLTGALSVILPAIDQIHALWIDGGIKIDINDSLWYSENSRFYDIVFKVLITENDNVILPTQIVFGANIQDPNTTVYDSYEEYLLEGEESITSSLNFAVYLNNVQLGLFVGELEQTFVENDVDVYAVKSNYGTTELSEFNSYKTVLDMISSLYNFALGYKYQLNIDASIVSADSSMNLNGDVRVALSDLTEDEVNNDIFDLFDGKALKVQGDLDLTSNSVRHLISLLYESNDTSALYATYTHGQFIDSGEKFRAKISNANLSNIISMVLAFADIDLGESLTQGLNLQPCTTDFSYLQSILGIGGKDVSSDVSQVDQILSSVENVTKLLKLIKLDKTVMDNGLYQTSMTINIDLSDEISNVKLILREEKQDDNSVALILREISIDNFVMSGNTINATILFNNFEDYSFDYLEKNPESEHIDFSDISSFVDTSVSTINTKGFNFSGSANVNIIGIDAITVEFDLHVTLDNDGKIYFYMEVSVPSFADVTYDLGGFGSTFTYYSAGVGFDNRISVLEYVDDILTVTQTTYGYKKTAFNSKETKVKVWTHSIDEIGSQMMTILAETLGLTDTVYNKISGLIVSMTPAPSLEQTILGFSSTDSGFTLALDGETLTGDNNFGDLNLDIGKSAVYSHNGKDYTFIDSVSTTIDIANGTLKIPLNLWSNPGTTRTTFSGVDLHTNDYFRQMYAYQIHSIQFEENGGEHVSDILQSAGVAIDLPTLSDIVTDDGAAITTLTFDGWWTTPTFEEGTHFTGDCMPNSDVVLYAKWLEHKVYYHTISYQTNSDRVQDSVTKLEGSDIELPIYDTYVVDNGITKTTRVFDGWWTTADFVAGTEFNATVMPSEDITLYAKWIDTVEYYRTITFQTNSPIKIDSITLLEGEDITIPTLTTNEETVGNTTTYYEFAGWFLDQTFENEFVLDVMPTFDVTLFAKWDVIKTETTYSLTVIDVDETLYTARVKSGDTLNLDSIEKVNSDTKFYSDANYQNEIISFVMPEADLTLYIRNKYQLTYTYYVLENNTYVQTTYSALLYQGETFTLMPQEDAYIDYKNADDELIYRTYYSFGDYLFEGDVVTSNVMPNYNFTFGNTMTTETKNYYKIVFDVRQYKTNAMVAGYSWKTASSFVPATIYLLEGEVLNLNQSAYQPTCQGYLTAIKIDLKTFKATSWGLSAWSNGTEGGSGFTSYTVNGADTGSDGYTITLYACWEKQ